MIKDYCITALGPPVCKKCNVIGQVTDKNDHELYKVKVERGNSYWHCPICRDADLKGYLIQYTESQQEEIKGNTIFLKFMKGIE